MNLLEAKIYNDGSNWIAIPHTERPYRQRRRRKQPEKSEELQQFEKAFTKSKGKRQNRKENEPGWTEGGKSAQQKIHPGK